MNLVLLEGARPGDGVHSGAGHRAVYMRKQANTQPLPKCGPHAPGKLDGGGGTGTDMNSM